MIAGTDIRPIAGTALGEGTAVGTSCVVIAYNEEPRIARTLATVLAQRAPGFDEVVVVDDGSTDSTVAVVRQAVAADPRVRLIMQARNGGRGAARAAGVAAARGSLIAMVDADILLPDRWLSICSRAIRDVDAVGGTAVPDGDAAYLHRRFGLTPKVRAATTVVAGSNGLFRREALLAAGIDASLRNGEDVALNERLHALGYMLRSLPGLEVEHHEGKSYVESVAWLYESGIGASRQLRRTGALRTPDLAAAGFALALVAAAVAAAVRPSAKWAGVPVAYTCATAYAHLATRFVASPTKAHRLLAAGAANAPLVGAYYLGRLRGSLKG